MKKAVTAIILSAIIILLLAACDTVSSPDKSKQDTEESKQEEIKSTEDIPNQDELVYFKSDKIVDKFFSDYNTIAQIEIPAEEIEKGNIRTKALVYIDDLYLEVINSKDFLSISMSSSVENETAKLYDVFSDTIKAVKPNTPDDDIQASWDDIHKTGYMVEGYTFDGIAIDYIPYKELSKGHSDLRIDLKIPLE